MSSKRGKSKAISHRTARWHGPDLRAEHRAEMEREHEREALREAVARRHVDLVVGDELEDGTWQRTRHTANLRQFLVIRPEQAA